MPVTNRSFIEVFRKDWSITGHFDWLSHGGGCGFPMHRLPLESAQLQRDHDHGR